MSECTCKQCGKGYSWTGADFCSVQCRTIAQLTTDLATARREREEARAKIKRVSDAVLPVLLARNINGVTCTEYVPTLVKERDQARADGKALAAVVRQAMLVPEKWTFTEDQQFTHTWHDWADVVPTLKVLIEKAKEALERNQ